MLLIITRDMMPEGSSLVLTPADIAGRLEAVRRRRWADSEGVGLVFYFKDAFKDLLAFFVNEQGNQNWKF